MDAERLKILEKMEKEQREDDREKRKQSNRIKTCWHAALALSVTTFLTAWIFIMSFERWTVYKVEKIATELNKGLENKKRN